MDAQFLDTLIKLAAAGTSGISIFAIFWIGWIIYRLPENASEQRHVTLRYFMTTCISIAVISGISGTANAYINSNKITELQDENIAINEEHSKYKTDMDHRVSNLNSQVQTYQAQVFEAKELIEAYTSEYNTVASTPRQQIARVPNSSGLRVQLKGLNDWASKVDGIDPALSIPITPPSERPAITTTSE